MQVTGATNLGATQLGSLAVTGNSELTGTLSAGATTLASLTVTGDSNLGKVGGCRRGCGSGSSSSMPSLRWTLGQVLWVLRSFVCSACPHMEVCMHVLAG